MKKTLLTLFLLLSVTVAWCQTVLNGTQRTQVMQKIERVAAATNNLQRTFTQTRTSSLLAEPVVMTGKLSFNRPDDVVWEYDSPQQRTIKVSKNNVTITADGKTTELNPRIKKMVQGFTSLFMNESGKMLDEKLFNVTMLDCDKSYRAEMKPLRKDMQRLFAKITFRFAKDTCQVEAITLSEREGDEVLIEFYDLK